ncbi:MAG: radical SAM protein [Candidatus Woesearchaeota archaeon]
MQKVQPKSFHLQWSITERCNLNCKHCYKNKKLIKEELKIDQELKILDKFIFQINNWELNRRNTRISFTGGEPFVKEGFYKLLEKCKKNHDKFLYGVLTNGTFINKETIKKLKDFEVDYIQISLEGMEENNDYIRGEGMFDEIIKSAKLVKNAGISVNFSMTVSKINLNDVPKVIKLCKEMDIPIAIRRLVPIGNAEEIKDSLLTPKEVKQLWQYVFKINQKVWNGVSIGCEDGMAVQSFPGYKPGDCSAGYASFTVLPNGDVYPCRRLPINSGNLTKQTFEEIYNSKEMSKLRNINNINDVCFECPYFSKCKGGAKCISDAYFGDFKAPDPQCWRLFTKLPETNLKWSATDKKRQLDSRWYK